MITDQAERPGTQTKAPECSNAMFGLEESAFDEERLEEQISVAAAGIAAEIAGLEKQGGMVSRNFGIASTLHGLWIHDGTESRYETNIYDYDGLHAAIGRLHGQGFAPIDLVGSTRLFEPWTVAFGPLPRGGHYWLTTPDENEFKAKDMELFHAGFRLTSFNRRHGAFNVTWAGGMGGAQWVKWDLDYFGLLMWNRHYENEGLRIGAIERYGDGGNRYAAVWQPGGGEQIIEAPGGLNVYFGQPSTFLVYKYERQGLRVHAMGHSGYPIAAFRPTNSPHRQGWTYDAAAPFRQADEGCRQAGYRLSFVSHAMWQFG